MARILILGGGFAAVAAAEELARSVDDSVDITMISSTSEFTFFPAIVPMVFGQFSLNDIHFDLRRKLSERNVRLIKGEILSIDSLKRTVEVTGNDVEGTVHYDLLLIAIGRRLATEKIPGFFENSHHLLNVEAAVRFKDTVAGMSEGRIIVGLCPNAFLPVPVCESALALAGHFSSQVADGSVSVSAVFPESLEDAFVGSNLFRDLRGSFEKRGVELVESFPISHVEKGRLVSGNGDSKNFDLLLLIPPFSGQTPVEKALISTNENGFVQVDQNMKVVGSEDIFAAGDIVSLQGPRFGYMAIRQGKVAAKNIAAMIKGDEPSVAYDHKIEWALGEKHTDPVFFHYGFWDGSLEDHDEDIFFGMAKNLRDQYGSPHDGS